MISNKNFYKTVSDNNYYTSESRLQYYMEQQLFKNVNFEGKSLIDIGGGKGVFGFYAAVNGASKVVVMEPEFDGSSSGMIDGFNDIKSLIGGLNNISHTNKVLEDYDRRNNQFDIILMHNSINHIDEEACIVLKENQEARVKYDEFFSMLNEISKPGARLIVCDCARSNLFGDIGVKNPFSPAIEWEKHQNPKYWAEQLKKNGYKLESIVWTTPNFLGKIGTMFLSNKVMSYFLLSHFRMVLTYNG